MNPKWVVCDPGWKDIYDAQMASGADNVQDSLKCWYPPCSGIREKIETIHKIQPEGFTQNLKIVKDTAGLLSKIVVLSEDDGTSAMDLAELELKNYETLQRSRKKLRAALVWMSRLSKKVDTNCSKVLVNELDVVKEKLALRRVILDDLRPTLRRSLNLETQATNHLNFRVSIEGTASPLLTRLQQLKVPISITTTSP